MKDKAKGIMKIINSSIDEKEKIGLVEEFLANIQQDGINKGKMIMLKMMVMKQLHEIAILGAK